MIPAYDDITLPLLRSLSDGQEHRVLDLVDDLAKAFKLTEEERNRLLPSGAGSQFHNRVSWARTYLGKAGLVEKISRGTARINC